MGWRKYFSSIQVQFNFWEAKYDNYMGWRKYFSFLFRNKQIERTLGSWQWCQLFSKINSPKNKSLYFFLKISHFLHSNGMILFIKRKNMIFSLIFFSNNLLNSKTEFLVKNNFRKTFSPYIISPFFFQNKWDPKF